MKNYEQIEKTMKHNEKQKKTIKNDETDRKKQGQMMKKREKTMKIHTQNMIMYYYYYY